MKDTSTRRNFINTGVIVENTSQWFHCKELSSGVSVKASFALGMATGRMTAYTSLLNILGTFSWPEFNQN